MKKIILTPTCPLLLSCGSKQEKILPRKTALTESVYSSLTVQPDSLYQVYAAVAGILDNNFVEEGDTVQKGTPLLQIINSTPRLNTENAKLAFQLARENYSGSSAVLKVLEDEIQAANLTFQNDSVNYFRQKRLWEQKIGSKVEFDNRKLAYELSRNNLNLLKSRYDRTQNELRTQVQQASNNVKTSQIATEDFTVTSKINGKVYALFKEPGEIVTTMESLASVGSASVFIIEMLVDGVDVRLLISEKNDSRLVNWSVRSYFEPLLRAGVKIYLFPDGFLHSKIMLGDDAVASVGTANIDVRSFEQNYETNTIIYDPKVVMALKEDFLQDSQGSHRLTYQEHQKRPWPDRLKEGFAKVFTPVL